MSKAWTQNHNKFSSNSLTFDSTALLIAAAYLIGKWSVADFNPYSYRVMSDALLIVFKQQPLHHSR